MQNASGPHHKQWKALVLTPCMMICTTIVSHFPEFLILFSFGIQGCQWSPSQLNLSACSQVSPEQPVHPHLSLLSWTTDELLFHTGNSCYWSPCLQLYTTALSTIKCHFMSITPNQQSHLNSFHMIIWSSSVLTIPPKFLSSHTAPGHTPRPCTQLRAWSRGSNATHLPPSWWLSLNTSFHSDNFICMQWLYLFFGQVLFHLSILALNHHLHFKP